MASLGSSGFRDSAGVCGHKGVPIAPINLTPLATPDLNPTKAGLTSVDLVASSGGSGNLNQFH